MNITEAQVSHVELRGDTFVIPPRRVLFRDLELYNTVAYDLLELGVTYRDVRDCLGIEKRFTEAHVREFVARHGRVIIDEWLGPVTYFSHVEPVKKETK